MAIRPTRLEEPNQVIPFYERARRLMIANGDANRRVDEYPASNGIRWDIGNGDSYVFVNENGELEGYFTFIREGDPNYKVIKDDA